MKRKLITAVTALSAASMLGLSALAAPAVEGHKTCEAYIADITVDGKIDDAWKYAPVIKVDTVKQNASKWYGDTTKIAGKDYAVVNAKVLWNGSSTLYILFEVKDNVISQKGANDWEKDSVEYFIQPENSTDSKASKSQVRLYADKSEVSVDKSGFGNARIQTDGGFIYEIAVDVSEVGGAGQYLGIDFQYNDDAEGKGVRNVCLGWSDSTDKASSDPSVYGQCLLSDKTVASIIEAEKKAAADKAKNPATADAFSLAALAASAAVSVGVMLRKRK